MNTNVRINKYDNLKGLAIFLIVLSHILIISEVPSAIFISKFVTIIHLPLFFFVSGYFSKIGPEEPIKSFKRLFVPYIIFNLIFSLCVLCLGNDITGLFIYPVFATWFLIVLFAMKLFLPILDKFKYPIFTSFILALIIGFIDIPNYILGITRFFTYLPIFLIGFYFNDYKTKFEEKYLKLSSILNNGYIYIYRNFNFN